ncbi:TPA: hypothetical protein ACH3X3_000224 [Trebouxia sp. C0006]
MQSSQPSRLEADQQLSVNPSSGDPVPEQSSELQAGVSSNVAAFQDLQDNQGSLAPADPSAAAYSPERPLITNKSNKLEWQEGEDAKLKQMLWVVENLQEELFRAQEYRLQAEKKQQRHRSTINSLQAELQTVTGALAALDDDLDMIQQQLEHQMQAQDQNQDDARELDKELMSLQALIHVRERNIAEKDRRIADIEKQILNEIEDAKAAKRREQADNASPRSNASSPWGSASESDEELNFRVSPARRSLSNYAKESLLPPAQRGATATGSASASASSTSSPAPSGWFRPFSMLGGGRKQAEDLKSAASTPPGLPLPPALPPAQSRTTSFTSSASSPLKRTSSGM